MIYRCASFLNVILVRRTIIIGTSSQVSYDPNENQKFCTKKKLVRAETQCHGDFKPYESTYQRDLCKLVEVLSVNARFLKMSIKHGYEVDEQSGTLGLMVE